MLTILNELFRQKEAGTLNSGVRALLLYPMNALVNDQLKRMRLLLATTPDITFGRYTGETPEKRKQAVEQHRNLHGCDPLVNERVCREEMRQSPPHILLTNYAMLEYLLLRPSDNVFLMATMRIHGNLLFWMKPIPITVQKESRWQCFCVSERQGCSKS